MGQQSLSDAIGSALRASAERPGLVFYDAEGARSAWTFGELEHEVRRLIAFLRARGAGAGARVAIVSENQPEVLVAYVACWWMGACACPLNVEERAERRRYILNNAQVTIALCDEHHIADIRALQSAVPTLRAVELLGAFRSHPDLGSPAEMPLDTPAFLIYTSGTTGDPKGVELRHANLLANVRATAEWHGLQPGHSVMTVLPIHHVNGAIVTGLAPLLAGARIVLNRRFSSAHFWRRLADERVTIASMVPTLLQFLLSADEDIAALDLGALRYLLCGAGPLLSETVLRFERRFGVPVCHGFGMSETTAYNTQMPMDLPAAERQAWYAEHGFPSIGCAIACNDVTILRSDGSEAAPRERGEIAIRGASVMRGYLNNPDANARAFRGGWFLSGDQGFHVADERGRKFFFVSGRIKELIIRGGTNLSPVEIDEVLAQHPAVKFALAVPFENLFYGEEVAAYVVPEPGALVTQAELIAFARARLPFARCPKVILFGQDVPYTTTGKPRRLELARRLAPELAAYRDVQFR